MNPNRTAVARGSKSGLRAVRRRRYEQCPDICAHNLRQLQLHDDITARIDGVPTLGHRFEPVLAV